MKVSVLSVAGLAIAGAAMAQTSVFTTQASFVAQLQPGFFLNNFNSVGGGAAASLSFNGGTPNFAYTITAVGTGTQQLFNDPGIISTDSATDRIRISFTGPNLPTAVGGNMWGSDINFLPVPGASITVGLSNGFTETFAAGTASTFRGYTTVAPITSIEIDAPEIGTTNVWSTLDNLYVGNVIPAPGAAALFGLAGLAGLRRRR